MNVWPILIWPMWRNQPGTKHRAREIWVYESLASFNADGVCFGAKIIRQFQAAGISLLVSVTPGEANTAALKKLMHNCKAQRWDFAAPPKAVRRCYDYSCGNVELWRCARGDPRHGHDGQFANTAGGFGLS